MLLALLMSSSASAGERCADLGLPLFGHVELIRVLREGYWRAEPESAHLTLRQVGGADAPVVRRSQQVCVGDELSTGPDVRVQVVSRWNDQLVLEPNSRGRFEEPSLFQQLAGSVLYYLGHPFRVLSGRAELVNEGTRYLVREGEVYVAEGKVVVADGGAQRRVRRNEAASLDLDVGATSTSAAQLGQDARRLSRRLLPPRVALGLDGVAGLIGTDGAPQLYYGPRLRLELAPLRYLGLELAAAYHFGGASEQEGASHVRLSAGVGLRIGGLGLWGSYEGALLTGPCDCVGLERLQFASGFGGTVRYTFWAQKRLGFSVDGRVGWAGFLTGGLGAGLAWGW